MADTLSGGGFDAVSVTDQVCGAPDVEVARVCALENRIIITLDTDFADIKAYPPGDHPGIIVLRPRLQNKSTVVGVIERLLRSLQSEDPTGKLWIVDEHRIELVTEAPGDLLRFNPNRYGV